MKKGKTSKLNIFDDAKCHYGTVDSKELKSIYVVLQTWIEPISDEENWNRITGILKRQILHTLLEVTEFTTFEKKQIVDLDLRTSGIQKNKKSFLNLEITLFVHDKTIDFKSLILRSKIKKIVSSIYHDDLKKSKYFILSKTKIKETVIT
jgi:type I site-specific restriction endonuclease